MASQTRPLTTKPMIDKTSQMTNRAMMSPIRAWYAPWQGAVLRLHERVGAMACS